MASDTSSKLTDVAVIGQAVSPNMKQRISLLIRQHCAAVKILELYPPHMGKVLDDADSSMEVPAAIRHELAERVNDLAKTRKGN